MGSKRSITCVMKFALDALLMPRYWHVIGRLHQRLANLSQAGRAYAAALLLDPHRPRTFNNLALLELSRLNAHKAERLVAARTGLQAVKS